MPSTTSSSLSRLLASSTVITPSLPTFCMALAIMSPMAFSPLAEIVPTCAISAEPLTFFARFSMSETTSATALSMPRFRSIGFMPAATDFNPSRTMAWASRVAVVVPSPAVSFVLELDLLGDGDAVLRRAGGAERLLEDDVAALRTERHLDRIGQDVYATHH